MVAGDDGTDMGDSQVVGLPRAGDNMGTRVEGGAGYRYITISDRVEG